MDNQAVQGDPVSDGADNPVLRRLQAQQWWYRLCMALLAIALLSLGIAAWLTRPAPRHLVAGGCSFDVCYPPGTAPVHRVYPAAEPGVLVLLYRAAGPAQDEYLLQTFRPGQRTLNSLEAFSKPATELFPRLGWGDGRLLATMYRADWPDGRYTHQLQLLHQHGRGPEGPMAFTTRRARPPHELALQDNRCAALYSVTEDGSNWRLARFGMDGTDRGERSVAKPLLSGRAWLGGTLTFALVTDDKRLLLYDIARDAFVEDKARAGLVRELVRVAAPHSGVLLAEDFAYCRPSGGGHAFVTAGAAYPLTVVSPLSQGPDGKPRRGSQDWLTSKWVPGPVKSYYLKRSLEAMLDPEESQRGFDRLSRRIVAEGPRVRADRVSDMFTHPVLVDANTIALVDTQYRRVTLVRRETAD